MHLVALKFRISIICILKPLADKLSGYNMKKRIILFLTSVFSLISHSIHGASKLWPYSPVLTTPSESHLLPGPSDPNEKWFWSQDPDNKKLISRILYSPDGAPICCLHYQYGPTGAYEEMTLFGNLSGTCPVPLLIDSNGLPIANGIESSSILPDLSPCSNNLKNGNLEFAKAPPAIKSVLPVEPGECTLHSKLDCLDYLGINGLNPSGAALLPSEFVGSMYTSLYQIFHVLKDAAGGLKSRIGLEIQASSADMNQIEAGFEQLVGESVYFLMGYSDEKTEMGFHGCKEIANNVRITFINGILTTKEALTDCLNLISDAHGGTKIHYVFRPTEGWTSDICRAALIKTAFNIGFRSIHAHLLADMWRSLIEEMGGVNGKGTIIHYAHSLGGSETDRARDLLTPEEQQKIRVTTLGSPTLVQNKGFQKVINVVSVNDGVSSFILDPFGWVKHYFNSESNVKYYGNLFDFPHCWPLDHALIGPTYYQALQHLGRQFCLEFANHL